MSLKSLLVSIVCVPALAVVALAQYQSAAEHPAIANLLDELALWGF